LKRLVQLADVVRAQFRVAALAANLSGRPPNTGSLKIHAWGARRTTTSAFPPPATPAVVTLTQMGSPGMIFLEPQREPMLCMRPPSSLVLPPNTGGCRATRRSRGTSPAPHHPRNCPAPCAEVKHHGNNLGRRACCGAALQARPTLAL